MAISNAKDSTKTRPHRQRQKEEVEMFDTTESVIANGTTRLIDSMYAKAKEFPVADHDEAVATLVEAAGETATLADVLLMLASVTTDGDMHDALVDCSKKASSATMGSIGAVRFLARKA